MIAATYSKQHLDMTAKHNTYNGLSAPPAPPQRGMQRYDVKMLALFTSTLSFGSRMPLRVYVSLPPSGTDMLPDNGGSMAVRAIESAVGRTPSMISLYKEERTSS